MIDHHLIKLALDDVGRGALMGGAAGALGLGYLGWLGGKQTQRRNRDDRYAPLRNAAGGAALGGLLGGTYGALTGADVRDARNRAERVWRSEHHWGRHGNTGRTEGASSWARAASLPWRDQAASAFDPAVHGAGMHKVWRAVVGSSELNAAPLRAAAIDFVKNVHRASTPDAVEKMRRHVETLNGTKAGEMASVLFHRYHGQAKAAAWARAKLAALDAQYVYGL